jgi:hypothetical protein
MKQGFRPASIPFESFFPDENLPPGNRRSTCTSKRRPAATKGRRNVPRGGPRRPRGIDKDVVLALLDPILPTDAGKFRQFLLAKARQGTARAENAHDLRNRIHGFEQAAVLTICQIERIRPLWGASCRRIAAAGARKFPRPLRFAAAMHRAGTQSSALFAIQHADTVSTIRAVALGARRLPI